MEAVQHTASRLAALGPRAPYPAALAGWLSGLAAGADVIRLALSMRWTSSTARSPASRTSAYRTRRRLLGWTALSYAAPPGYPADAVAGDVNGALEVLDRLEAKPQTDRARAVLRQLGRRPPSASGDHEEGRLSVREEEVARLVAQGLSNAEVGERLFISTRTVGAHLQHIYRRLELPSRAALIRYVLEESPTAEVTSQGSPNR